MEAKKTIKNLLGKNNPIFYKPEFNVQENWETSKIESVMKTSISSWKS